MRRRHRGKQARRPSVERGRRRAAAERAEPPKAEAGTAGLQHSTYGKPSYPCNPASLVAGELQHGAKDTMIRKMLCVLHGTQPNRVSWRLLFSVGFVTKAPRTRLNLILPPCQKECNSRFSGSQIISVLIFILQSKYYWINHVIYFHTKSIWRHKC